MTPREPLLDQAYFEKTIAYRETTPARFEARIQQPDTAPEHRVKLLYKLFRDSYETLLTKYSAGYPVLELRASFPGIVERRERHQQALGRLGVDFAALDDYGQSLWLVSLAILLNVEDSVFKRLLATNGNDGRDSLYERLVSVNVQGRPTGEEVLFPKPYQTLYAAATATESERPQLVSDFLKVWYTSMGKLGMYWHDNHKGTNGGGFFGYWCLEAAAVVKAFKIDDSKFRDVSYYPKDLLQR